MDWKAMLANAHIERQIDALIEAGEVVAIEEYERPLFDDDFRRAAEAAVAAHENGDVHVEP
jgi:hypothetical protein